MLGARTGVEVVVKHEKPHADRRFQGARSASLEESLCAGGQRVGTECDYHRKLVNTMKPSDSIISFNYDCLIDETLRTLGSGKWNPR